MRGRRPKNPDREFPNRIREWRERRGLSITQLAEAMQSNYQTVARHETRNNDMTLARLERYATVLSVRTEELLRDSERVLPSLQELLDLVRAMPSDQQAELQEIASVIQKRGRGRTGGEIHQVPARATRTN